MPRQLKTTTKGTGTFVVVWTGVAARPGDLSRSVTSEPPKAGLLLQIEIFRPTSTLRLNL